MAIDFPASPSVNDTHTVGSTTWTWDGTKWGISSAGGGSGTSITVGNTTAEVVDTGSDGHFKVTTEGTERLRVDASGRIGIGGITPSAWANTRVFDFGNSGLSQDTAVDGNISLSQNTYALAYNSWVYKASSQATRYAQDSGNHTFYTASSGTAGNAITFTERMRIDNNGQTTATIGTSSGNYYVFSTVGNGTNCFRVRDNGQIYMGLASASPYNATTVAAANANLDSNGFFYRSTSSIKYKTDIETLDDSYADAILGCRPVWYRSTTGNDNPEWGYWGFIAEEVAEIDPRLVSWKTHELQKKEDGTENVVELATPEPEGVQYDRFVPHLLNLIKRQQQAIETLETTNASQAATIAAIEARLTALEGGN